MTTKQTFGSALKRPWALVLHGAARPPGRRPSTSVAYLTDDEGEHYLGGYVWFGRVMTIEGGLLRRSRYPCWNYRYKYATHILKAEVVEIFSSTDKSKFGGPSPTEIRTAKRALRPTPAEEPAKVAIPITWESEHRDD